MTTIPSRVMGLPATLRSLRRQLLRPDRIYLHVPDRCAREEKPYDLTSIEEEIHAADVTVVRDIPDDGPITKLVPLLDRERSPRTLLVLVDDDTEYGPSVLFDLYRRRRLRAVGVTGRVPVFKAGGELESLEMRGGVEGRRRVAFLETATGVLYERRLFPSGSGEFREWLRTLPPEARYVDDIVIGAHLSARRAGRYLVEPGRGYYCVHETNAPLALAESGNLAWRNVAVFETLREKGYFRESSSRG